MQFQHLAFQFTKLANQYSMIHNAIQPPPPHPSSRTCKAAGVVLSPFTDIKSILLCVCVEAWLKGGGGGGLSLYMFGLAVEFDLSAGRVYVIMAAK